MASSRNSNQSDRNGSAMDSLIGGILRAGIIISLCLLLAGLIWHWAVSGKLQLEYSISGKNFFHFLQSDLGQAAKGKIQPHLLINSGIAALILTPFIRVLTSIIYFAFIQRELKFVLFTGFVFCILTYSLFFR